MVIIRPLLLLMICAMLEEHSLENLKFLKKRYPDAKYEIMVCHAVNIKGLVNLCNNFDRVIITNSYCDYGYKPSNNNLTVIDVCG